MKQIPAPEIFSQLTQWAFCPDASTDLRNIFGGDSDRYQPLLQSIRSGDFSWVPEVQILSASSMEYADGAYSRKTRSIYISADCPLDQITSVLLEEIGHHIDALFNEQETPGDEGALFSAAVLGISLSDEEITALLNEDDSAILSLNGHQVAVECARRPAPASRAPAKPIVTAKPKPKTPVPVPVNNTLEAAGTTDLSTIPDYNGLILTGSEDIVGIGNSKPTNYLQANDGNTTLVAGSALATTLVAGAGNNFLDGRLNPTKGTLYIKGGAGNSTMMGGSGKATILGGTGNNYIEAGSGDQLLIGGEGINSVNTIKGGIGKDTLKAGKGYSTLQSGSRINGSNVLVSDGLSSSLVAGAGNDSLSAALFGGNVTIVGGRGKTWLGGGKDSNSLVSGSSLSAESNTLLGGSGSNTLVAGSGKDLLKGGDSKNLFLFSRNNIANQRIYLSNKTSSTNILGLNSASKFSLQDANLNGLRSLSKGATLNGISNYGTGAVDIALGQNAITLKVQSVTGGVDNDTLSGLSYNLDGLTLNGGAGADRMIGGAGGNYFIVDNAGDSVIEAAGRGMDTLKAFVDYSLTSNVEVLILGGRNAINGTGNAANNTLLGNSAQNSLSGGDGNDSIVGNNPNVLPDISFVGRNVSAAAQNYITSGSNSLINGLGGPSGYGTGVVTPGDDNSALPIDITSVFGANGLNFYGNRIKQIYINNNGNITFNNPASSFTPTSIDAGLGTPIIAPFWADVDTRGNTGNISPGGTSNGANRVYWNVDSTNKVITVTWDDVGFYSRNNTKVNAFQLQLIDSGNGDGFIVFRYEAVNWTTGSASGGTLGLGGSVARAGFNSGTGQIIELPQSGDQSAMLGLAQTTPNVGLNSNAPGVFVFEVRNGQLSFEVAGDYLAGGAGSDTLKGGDGNNTLDGGTGNDVMTGGSGEDTYVVDTTGDTIIDSAGTADAVHSSVSFDLSNTLVAGGSDIENLVYTGSGAATLTGNAANNSITGNNQNNTLEGKGGVDTLSGGSGEDTYVVDTTGDTIIDSAGTADAVHSSVSFDLSNTLVAGGSDIENLVYTGSGAATLTGNAANNSITGGLGSDSIIGGAGNDTVLGRDGKNTLDGGADNDSLIGGSDADSIIGGAGNDILDGGAGDNIADTLNGGTGDDTYIIDSYQDVLIETLNGGTDTVRTSLSYQLQDNFENLVLTGTAISAVGNAANNSLFGNDSDNEIDGGAGNDTMVGGLGNDTYYVGEAGDWVIESLGGGTNTAIVAAGAEGFTSLVSGGAILNIRTLTEEFGSDGNDTLDGTPLNDTISGLAGDDIISGFKGNDSLLGGDGNDTLNGGVGLDILSGGAGNDSLIGGDGLDTLIGGTGNDTYVIDVANPDIIVEDSLSSGGLADIIQVNGSFSMADLPPPAIGVNAPNPYAGIEGLVYTGSTGVTLAGNSTKNTITGGSGNDSIVGGAGNDAMIGGQGNDTYVFEDLGDVVIEDTLASGGIDQINAALVDVSLAADSGVENIVLLGALSIAASGSNGANSILGNDASNALRGNGGNDTLLGNGGDDLLDGGLGADSLVGGTGNDTYILNPVNLNGAVTIEDILVEKAGEGTDEIRVAASVDLSQLPDFENVTLLETETPSAFNDFVVLGNAASNVIKGNGGNNSLDGGAGADTMIGGSGNDTYRVDNSGDIVQEDTGAGSDTVISTLDRYTLTDNVENLQVIGGVGSTGIGNIAANSILGNASDNSLVGLGGADTIIAGLGNDTLDGGFDQRLFIQTTDRMVGGGGDDYYIVDNVGDTVVEEVSGGNDTIELYPTTVTVRSPNNVFFINRESFNDAGLGAPLVTYSLEFYLNRIGNIPPTGSFSYAKDYYYVLPGNIENLIARTRNVEVRGGNFLIGANYLYGNSSGNYITATSDLARADDLPFNDYMDGQGGQDTMAGGLGDDTYVVDNLGDRVIESSDEGTDFVLATASYDLSTSDIIDSATGQTVSTVENLILLNRGETIVNGRPVTTVLASLDFNGSGNMGDNVITGNSGNNILDGKAGDDIIDGGLGSDTILGGTGNDELLGGLGNDSLNGGEGNDILDGQGDTNILAGGAGDDLYVINAADGGTNTLTEAAGEGIDKVETDLATFSLLAQGANVEIEILEYTGVGSTNLTGNNIANTLIGGAVADDFYGLGGDDVIYIDAGVNAGGTPDTIVDGGSGTDLVVSDANVDLTDGRFTDVENILLTGTAAVSATGRTGKNRIDGSQNSAANVLTGNGGNDTFVVDGLDQVIGDIVDIDLVESASSVDLTDTTRFTNVDNIFLTGTAAINAKGTTGANIITGNSGANRIDGFCGADTLIGGEGNDTLVIDAGGTKAAIVDGGTGTDLVESDSTIDLTDGRFTDVENILLTGTVAINATGTAWNNTITGNSVNNSLDGNGGIDTLIGGDGNDTYIIDSLSDVVLEDSLAASGNADAVVAKVNGYTLASNVEHLILGTASSIISGKGNRLGNSLIGNASNNSLDGAAGDDTLLGGDGNDTLLGGEGNDYLDGQALDGLTENSLVGGAGNDTYVINGEADVIVEDTLPIGGTDSVLANLNYALQNGLEHLRLNGTLNLTGWGNSADNSLTGNSGNNNLIGYEGNDTLDGQGGNDTMAGGSGNDFYVVDEISDIVTETDASTVTGGIDVVQSSVTYTLSANVENLILTGSSVINGTGNSLDNRIDGSENSAANVLTGNGGNDTFIVDGLDQVIGGSGTDLVESRFSVDLNDGRFTSVENILLTGTADIDATGNLDNNAITGNDFANSIDGFGGADTLIGAAGNDTLMVTAATAIIDGGNDTDLVVSASDIDLNDGRFSNVENILLIGAAAIHATGNALANTITGNSADNSLDGGFGADSMIGGVGNDTYFADNTGDTVFENAFEGTDIVFSTTSHTLGANIEILTYTGSASATLTGNSEDNTIIGNAQGNRLDGAGGIDSLIGGTGNDTYVVDNLGDIIVESLRGGTDLVESSINYTLGGNLEQLSLTGTAVSATGNELANTITGNASDNSIDGGAGIDSLIGGAGNDTYIVDNEGDTVFEAISGAAGGTDQVNSSVNFTLGTNVENLSLTGGSNINGTGNGLANTITGNSGDNSIFGNGGRDNLFGLAGNDFLNGGALEDELSGGSGDDTLYGGEGSDVLKGGVENDTYIIDDLSDLVIEFNGEGTDTVIAKVENLTLAGNVEKLILDTGILKGTGNSGDNTIIGNASNNTIGGAAGDDTLFGGAGNDTLLGGDGNDYLDGEDGNDSSEGGSGDDFYVVNSTGDVITENLGQGTDTVLSSIDWALGANFENLILTGIGGINGTGNTLANRIDGSQNSKANSLTGNGGNDTFVVDGSDMVIAGSGTDLVESSFSVDLTNTRFTGVENILLTGTANINATGDAGDNSITGNSGDNQIKGTDSASFGTNEVDTLTGENGADLFHLGDGANAYYDKAANGGDYALITDFSVTAGDQLQLRDLSASADPSTVNGYLIGDQIYGAIGSANSYIYFDSNTDGTINAGDNLIAAINATGGGGAGGALVTADLNDIGKFM